MCTSLWSIPEALEQFADSRVLDIRAELSSGGCRILTHLLKPLP